MTNPELQELLERLHDRYNRPEFIEDDPIAVPHRYTDRADREIAGFLAATIAWGNRKAIVRNGHRLMRLLDDAPADFVRNASERELARLGGFVHRTFNGGDLCDFVRGLRRMERDHGGVRVTRLREAFPPCSRSSARSFSPRNTLRAARNTSPP